MNHDKVKKSRRTSQEMYAHIRAWEAGGQSRKDYLLAHGISSVVFGYWLRRYRDEGQSGFVEVSSGAKDAGHESGRTFARIKTTRGAELILYEAVSAAWLRELLW